MAAVSYALLMMGFLIQDVGPALPHELHRIPANVCFLLSACTLVAAVLRRYDVSVPTKLMTTLVVVAMAGHCWFLLIHPSLAARIYFISSSLGIVALIAVVKLHPVKKPHLVDRLLFWIAVLVAANFILRPIVIGWLVGNYDSHEDFQRSIYWTTVLFTQAMVSIMVALSLMAAIAIDLMGELRQEANTDQLSGLLNRRGFEKEAATVLQHGAARGRPAALLIADLDNFKLVNDTYGHAIGDKVISIFGELVLLAAIPGIVAGRIGGEEFAILMPAAEMGAARSFAERLRDGFGKRCEGRLPTGLRPSISIGIHVSHAGMSLYDLLSNADAALYAAKRSGRDRVNVFAPEAALVPELALVAEGVAQY